MISLVPLLSALERMIAACQACFCEALRSLVSLQVGRDGTAWGRTALCWG